jgi:hypothetical protein
MTNDNTYIIDWQKMVLDNTPASLRLPKVLAWLNVFIKPITKLYIDFLVFRKAKKYQLLITPQVCYLEKILNDRFDYTQRRIYIEDGEDRNTTFLYKRIELKPVYLWKRSEAQPRYFYTRGEAGINTNDFIIKVPIAVVFDMQLMIGVVRAANNLPGTKFKIQTF